MHAIEVRNGNRRIYLDGDEWCVEIGGPGNPVIRSTDKQKIEEFLDYVDNRDRSDQVDD